MRAEVQQFIKADVTSWRDLVQALVDVRFWPEAGTSGEED